ncbi:hypothetical protein KL86DPRO_10993 [uncultured delta proteobacterium]|uniref:YkgJ family cysteine cluster protein n=1 Tax=uncultured delta proteobacterium TaxID=34034 RepID=A0A212J9L4_9DELT|nr:hypothetical protein KL86DPRO_10993 [uncultured delta proteobacterium]
MWTYRQETMEQYRLDMPRAERRHPWLRHAFDLYAVVDASVAEALAASGRKSGCAAGCHGCCHQTIPVTPLEVAALQWFIREEMPRERLLALREKPDKTGPDGGPSCRFLLGRSCAAYAVRPVACRRYMVLGEPCAMGEDATKTRPRDVLAPSREALNAACALALPYYAALGETIPGPEGAFAFMAERTVALATVSRTLLRACP